jgi:CheY-like chemotaxis protein
MRPLRVLYCDDEPEAVEAFQQRHSKYDIEPLYDVDEVVPRIQELDRTHDLPDLVVLDLYHRHDVDPGIHHAASTKLDELQALVTSVKDAVERSAAPGALDALRELRERYGPHELPVMVRTRRGYLFLDDDGMREIAEHDAGWLVKDNDRLLPATERSFIRRHLSRSRRPLGDRVFIGHGHTPVWQELSDFVKSLGFPVDEFDAVSNVGHLVRDRVAEMVDAAGVALLVHTGEDQHGASLAPRLNVVHETGYCQGRLGFDRTAILLEEGCELFSNAQGDSRIHFAPGKLHETFPKVEAFLLERMVSA